MLRGNYFHELNSFYTKQYLSASIRKRMRSTVQKRAPPIVAFCNWLLNNCQDNENYERYVYHSGRFLSSSKSAGSSEHLIDNASLC